MSTSIKCPPWTAVWQIKASVTYTPHIQAYHTYSVQVFGLSIGNVPTTEDEQNFKKREKVSACGWPLGSLASACPPPQTVTCVYFDWHSEAWRRRDSVLAVGVSGGAASGLPTTHSPASRDRWGGEALGEEVLRFSAPLCFLMRTGLQPKLQPLR